MTRVFIVVPTLTCLVFQLFVSVSLLTPWWRRTAPAPAPGPGSSPPHPSMSMTGAKERSVTGPPLCCGPHHILPNSSCVSHLPWPTRLRGQGPSLTPSHLPPSTSKWQARQARCGDLCGAERGRGGSVAHHQHAVPLQQVTGPPSPGEGLTSRDTCADLWEGAPPLPPSPPPRPS